MISGQLGIVVIGRNEGERLVRCFQSLKPQLYNVVYVDSGSTDRSTQHAEQAGAVVVNLETVSRFTAGRARNRGYLALKAACPALEFVQFIDGDCELDPAWLERAAAFLQQRKDVAVVCGRRRERFPQTSIYNQLADIEWATPCGETSSCGGDALVRVEAFEKAAGFRPDVMAGEEPELCARIRGLGWKIWRLDAEMTRHDIDLSRFDQWWRRVFRTGYGYAEVSRLLRHSSDQTYLREVARAVFWGGMLPAIAIVGALISPIATLVLLAYPIQIARIALRRRVEGMNSWAYALLLMVGKFAEAQGVLKFYWNLIMRRKVVPIEYKGSSLA